MLYVMKKRKNQLISFFSYQFCEHGFSFESLGETTVKGKDHPIAVFMPLEIQPEVSDRNSSVMV